MRQRLRPHLTFANVVALLALFVALGGTAAAALIITDNSQVAQNTISGHKPPSGKHANIIAGSINGQDVYPNSLGGRVIAEPTLTGNARKLIYTADIGDHQPTKLATVGPYAIKAACEGITPAHWILTLYANGPSGTADSAFMTWASDTEQTNSFFDTVVIPASQDAVIGSFTAATSYQVLPDGSLSRYAGTVMLRSGSVLVQLDLNIRVDATDSNQFPRDCSLLGTATNAT
jgi:hypothetical protein